MKKYYCITILALLVVTLLQGYNVSLQYKEYICKPSANPFGCGKIEFRQRVQRILPAEISTYHLQTSDTALHAVMLVDNLNITHKQLQYRRFCLSFKFQIAPMINLLAII